MEIPKEQWAIRTWGNIAEIIWYAHETIICNLCSMLYHWQWRKIQHYININYIFKLKEVNFIKCRIYDMLKLIWINLNHSI